MLPFTGSHRQHEVAAADSLHHELAWIVVGGPEEKARYALARLEFVADAYLSVGTPVQMAAADLLALGTRIREQIRRRIDRNEQTLRKILGNAPGATLFPRDGGWYAVIGLPAGMEDEEFALRLLREQDVIVQPGYLFDFEDLQTVIVSLLKLFKMILNALVVGWL